MVSDQRGGTPSFDSTRSQNRQLCGSPKKHFCFESVVHGHSPIYRKHVHKRYAYTFKRFERQILKLTKFIIGVSPGGHISAINIKAKTISFVRHTYL